MKNNIMNPLKESMPVMKVFTTILLAVVSVFFLTISANAQEVFRLAVLLDNAGLSSSEVRNIHEALRATKIVRDNTNAVPGVVLRTSYHVFGIETYNLRPDELRVIEISSDTEFVRRETLGLRSYITDCSSDSLASLGSNTKEPRFVPDFCRRYGEIVAAPTLGVVLISRNTTAGNLLKTADTPSGFQEFVRIVDSEKLHARGKNDKEDKPLTTVMSLAFEEFVKVAAKRVDGEKVKSNREKSDRDELERLRKELEQVQERESNAKKNLSDAEVNMSILEKQLGSTTGLLSNELSQAKTELKKAQDELKEVQNNLDDAKKKASDAENLRIKIAQSEKDLKETKEALKNGVSAEEAERLRAKIAEAEASLRGATNQPIDTPKVPSIVAPTDSQSNVAATSSLPFTSKSSGGLGFIFAILALILVCGGIFAVVNVIMRKKYRLTIVTEDGEELQFVIKGNSDVVFGKLIEDIGDASGIKIRAAKMDGLDGGDTVGFQICESSGNWFMECGSMKNPIKSTLGESSVFAAGSDEYKVYSGEYAPRPAAKFLFEKI